MTGFRDQDFSIPAEKRLSPSFEVAERPTSNLAVVSLVFGILAWTLIPLVGAVVAVITGHAALSQIRDSGGRVGGKPIARVGMGLGYANIALGLIVLLLVAIVLGFAIPSLLQIAQNEAQVLAKIPSVRGVKLANEMDHGDFQLIETSELEAEVPEGEVIACYNAGATVADPEFALLTRQKLIYLKDGKNTQFALKDVVHLKDDPAYEKAYLAPGTTDPDIYHVEVQAANGQRMRIEIQPPKDGTIFFDALRSTVKAAGGKEIASEPILTPMP